MALRYETSFDIASLSTPGVSILVTDSGGSLGEIIITAGLHTHTDISSVDSDFTAFAAALQAQVDAVANDTHTITWNGTTGYSWVTNSASTLSLEFTTPEVTSNAQGTNMRRILGFSGDQTGAAGTTGYSSDVRPYYLIIPAIQGRSEYTMEHEVGDIVNEAVADDGSRAFIAKTTADKPGSWKQTAEIETVPANFEDPGTPTLKKWVDTGTNADDVPWSYEHMFEHVRTHHHALHVIDGSDSEVWAFRADGMFLDHTRWSGVDLPLWQVPFRCRLIGRV